MSFSFRFLLEEIEAALSPTTAEDEKQSDFYVYETLKRGERDLDSKSSAYQLAFLENIFDNGEYKETAKRSRAINSHMLSLNRHKIQRRNSISKAKSHRVRVSKAWKAKPHLTKHTHRNAVPRYYYEPINELRDEMSDEDSSQVDLDPAFTIPHPLNTMGNPHERGLTAKTKFKLDQKVLDVLKRVGLGIVTISDLSLGMTATPKEVILRVSGKAAPKVIGGWFNFEIIRKDIFAVAFTAEQAGFEDFIAKIFNAKIGLFEKLEQTTVSS